MIKWAVLVIARIVYTLPKQTTKYLLDQFQKSENRCFRYDNCLFFKVAAASYYDIDLYIVVAKTIANPSVAETGFLRVNQIITITMTAHALAPCIARSSGAMTYVTTHYERISIFHKKEL